MNNKIVLSVLTVIANIGIFFSNNASTFCLFIFNYEPEMPESMLEE